MKTLHHEGHETHEGRLRRGLPCLPFVLFVFFLVGPLELELSDAAASAAVIAAKGQ
jgi:hypothetical protein